MTIEPYLFEAADGQQVTAELGRLAVPENRSNPRGSQIELAFVCDFPFPYVCDAWGSPDLGPAFRARVRSGVPTLFLSGALDGRTPASNAEEIRRGFPNSTHVIIENTTHGDHLLLSSPETGEVMVSFLKGETVAPTRIPAPPLQWEPVTFGA